MTADGPGADGARRDATLARWTLGWSWGLALLVTLLLPRLPQDPAYHDFAPTGEFWGVPNAGNVLSNLAFVLAGAVGLRALARRGGLGGARLPEAVFFAGLLLTGFGSGWYHWAPDHAGLAWDRLAMTAAFLGLYVALLGRCLGGPSPRWLLPAALALGAASVAWWAWTESRGAGDLRPYAVVQYLPMVLLPWMLWRWPPPALDRRWLWAMLGLYAAAKACELLDAPIAAVMPTGLSGHACKHLIAAAAGPAYLLALRWRDLTSPSRPGRTSPPGR